MWYDLPLGSIDCYRFGGLGVVGLGLGMRFMSIFCY